MADARSIALVCANEASLWAELQSRAAVVAKAEPALADLMVIIMSGIHTQSEEQADGLSSGADGFIARPVGDRELVARIEAFGHMMIGQPLRLLIEGLPERWGRIAWRRGFDHGLAFEAKFKLDDLAAHALALQPLKPLTEEVETARSA